MPTINVSPTKENTCAVIVAFHPGKNLKSLFPLLLKQVSNIIIIDNTPIRGLGRYQVFNDNTEPLVKIIRNKINLGIAAGLNTGIEEAISQGHKWCAIFDQDSRPSQKYFTKMSRCISRIPKHVKFGIIGCNYYKWIQNRKKVGYAKPKTSAYIDVPTVISSGSFFLLDAFKEIGSFREDFFIDHVDHEYCLRSRKKGFRVVLNPFQLVEHSVGKISFHRILWKWLETSNHSAERRYYWHRNLILLVKAYFGSEPIWCLKMLSTALPTGLINIVLFEKMKRRKVLLSLKGLWHGLLNRMENRYLRFENPEAN